MNIRRTVQLCAISLLIPCVGCQSIPSVKVSDKLASAAREQLLAPARHEIHLSMVDVPTAVREIQQTYGWTSSPDMNLEDDFSRLSDLRVTIDREAGSLAEVLADLCNQTGFHAFEDFGTLGIYGAIGHEETGGRGLAFAKGGLLLLLSINQFQCDKPKTYSIFPSIVDAVPWLYHEDARLQIEEMVYPDGTSIRGLGAASFISDLPFEPLLTNEGLIKSIRGVLWLQLPKRVAVEVVSFQPKTIPQEERRKHNFLRITELKETKEGWLLACEFGHHSLEREELRLDYGHADVLDVNGTPMDGRTQSVGSGSRSSGGWQSSTNEDYKTFEIEYPSRPASIRWTYVTEMETYSIPFHFTNCRAPDVIWKQDEEEKQAQQPDGAVTQEPARSAAP